MTKRPKANGPPAPPPVFRSYPVVIGGRVHRLRLDLNALAEAQLRYGWTPMGLNPQKIGGHDLRMLLWAGLLHERPNDPEFTAELVGGWRMNFGEVMQGAIKALNQLFTDAEPEAEADDDDDEPANPGEAAPEAGPDPSTSPAGPGTSSTPSPASGSA